MSLLLHRMLFGAISSIKSCVTGSRPCRFSEFWRNKASYMCYNVQRTKDYTCIFQYLSFSDLVLLITNEHNFLIVY